MVKYTLEEAKHIWVTSDTHFNHANIIKYCNRPFSSVEEMNEALINNWNNVISHDDTVYHLGDFAMGDKSLIPEILGCLNGHIHFIMGNHDNLNIINNLVEKNLLKSIFWEEVIKIGKKTIIMNHYPFGSLPDPLSNNPVIQLHGHVHSTPDKPWIGLDNQYDIGVDNNNFAPINLCDVLEKIHYKIHIK